MDINSIGKIKDKLWSKYPLSLLDLSDEWAVLTHKGDMTVYWDKNGSTLCLTVRFITHALNNKKRITSVITMLIVDIYLLRQKISTVCMSRTSMLREPCIQGA